MNAPKIILGLQPDKFCTFSLHWIFVPVSKRLNAQCWTRSCGGQRLLLAELSIAGGDPHCIYPIFFVRNSSGRPASTLAHCDRGRPSTVSPPDA